MKKYFLLLVTVVFAGTVLAAPITALANSTQKYVALGDSVAAGAGLNSVNATGIDAACDRSAQAYPYRVAQGMGMSVEHLACSGAKVDEGVYRDQKRASEIIPAQLDAAFADGTPDIITITIGANDARWADLIRQCYVWKCGSKFDEVRTKAYRADLRLELYWTLYKINYLSVKNGDTPPRVLLGGYYAPFSDTSCTQISQISPAEQAWSTQQTAELNQAINSVVPLFNFAQYVPVDFDGHELCTNDSWIQGAQDDAPFHPTATGQAAIAESFLQALGRP